MVALSGEHHTNVNRYSGATSWLVRVGRTEQIQQKRISVDGLLNCLRFT
jgi:hypothetical protein